MKTAQFMSELIRYQIMNNTVIQIIFVGAIVMLTSACAYEKQASDSQSNNQQGINPDAESQTPSARDGDDQKPGDGIEGIPGYLVDPNLIAWAESFSETDDVIVKGQVTLQDDSLSYSDVLLSIWGVTGTISSPGNAQILKFARVAADGMFAVAVDSANFSRFIISAGNDSIQGIEASIDDGQGFTNTVDIVVNDTNLDTAPFANDALQNITYASDTSDKITVLLATPNPPLDSSPNMELIYMNKVPRVESDEIEAQIELHNRGEGVVLASDFEIRYYLDLDGLTPEIEFAPSTNSLPENRQVAFNEEGGYLSLTIESELYMTEKIQIKYRFTITNQESLDFDQSNDQSFILEQTSKAPTDRINLYYRGERILGNISD